MFFLDSTLEIATVSKVHHNAEFTALSFVYFSETDDIRMIKDFKYLGFLKGLFSLLLTHIFYVDLLDDSLLFV
jgi:hypothetical protein